MPEAIHIRISPTRVIRLIGMLALLLTVLSLIATAYQYRLGRERWLVRLVNLDREWNLPTLLKSGLWLLNAGLVLLIALRAPRRGGGDRRRWQVLGAIFAYLAFDELLQFHEQLSTPVRALTGVDGVLHFAWVLPVAALLVLLAVIFARLFFALPSRFRRRFALAAAIYVGGAMGFELIGGRLRTLFGEGSYAYILGTQIEETLQLGGELLLLATLLRYLVDHLGVRRLEVAFGSQAVELPPASRNGGDLAAVPKAGQAVLKDGDH